MHLSYHNFAKTVKFNAFQYLIHKGKHSKLHYRSSPSPCPSSHPCLLPLACPPPYPFLLPSACPYPHACLFSSAEVFGDLSATPKQAWRRAAPYAGSGGRRPTARSPGPWVSASGDPGLLWGLGLAAGGWRVAGTGAWLLILSPPCFPATGASAGADRKCCRASTRREGWDTSAIHGMQCICLQCAKIRTLFHKSKKIENLTISCL